MSTQSSEWLEYLEFQCYKRHKTASNSKWLISEPTSKFFISGSQSTPIPTETNKFDITTNIVNCHLENLKSNNSTLKEFQLYNVNDNHHEDVPPTTVSTSNKNVIHFVRNEFFEHEKFASSEHKSFGAFSVFNNNNNIVPNKSIPTTSKNIDFIGDLVQLFSSKSDLNPEIDCSDRGAPVNIMNLDTAKKLQLLIQPVPSNKTFTIVFGKKSARESVNEMVNCGGLLDTTYTVKNAEYSLISDSSFTDKGGIIIQDDIELFGIAYGEILFHGLTNRNAPITSNDNLYNLDIKTLIAAPNPSIIGNHNNKLDLNSAESLVKSINRKFNLEKSNQNDDVIVFPAKPNYSISDVRACRKLVKGWSNRSAFSLADTTVNDAVKNIPPWLTPALLYKTLEKLKGEGLGLDQQKLVTQLP